jgi:hypothetical protein
MSDAVERMPVNPGTVEWAGDNPGIYLRKSSDGPWTGLGIFFRVLYSPHGRGTLMIVLGDPGQATGFPDSRNVCLTTNAELAHYLINNFIKKFPSFRGQPGLDAMTWLEAESYSSTGDMQTSWTEVMHANGCTAQMSWNDLGTPFAVEVGPKDCATGAHDMYSVFLEAQSASVTINSIPLTGQVCERLFFGKKMSTAFIAVSETWVRPAASEE